HLLGFLNGVYELNNDVFRQGKADDYISRVVPYEWRESTAEELNKVDEHFAKVFPIEDERALFWQIMASCIHGQLLERFIIFTGKGANSKDSIMTNLIPAVLGEHYYRANNSCLTQQQNKIGTTIGKQDQILQNSDPSKLGFEDFRHHWSSRHL
ncbi:MAG: hypothetical protein EBS53_14295, partial [Bacteroidetes bacterium]|nr:hypothetical protein [Bacteroidota bacterium]